MPMSQRTSCLRALAACLLSAGALAQSAAPRAFTADFGSVSLDLRNNQSIYTDVEITDGNVTIRAGEGATEETSLENSRWQFAGGVSIVFETAELTAGEAEFTFANGQLVAGAMTGEPVEITDVVDEQGTTVRGTAERIEYDNQAQTAALSGRATLALGANEYSGCDLVYNLAQKTFTSGSSDCGVQVTIYPEARNRATENGE